VDTFLFALLLVLALSLGGRDQWLVAQWSGALGRSMPLLVLGMACAGLSAALMAWLGEGFAALLPPRAAQMLVAFALAIAGFELVWPVKHKPPPREPTRSLGAIAIVLLARQVGDAARFGVFALAAWAHLPATAALGGAIGGAGAMAIGWSLGATKLARWPLLLLRQSLAAGLLMAALLIGLDARFGASG
jgi:putative Ca2+/H+ antiporter (TMEM165/GDT1 family)